MCSCVAVLFPREVQRAAYSQSARLDVFALAGGLLAVSRAVGATVDAAIAHAVEQVKVADPPLPQAWRRVMGGGMPHRNDNGDDRRTGTGAVPTERAGRRGSGARVRQHGRTRF